MVSLRTLLLKIFNTVLPFIDFLYILQLEDYYNSRYFKWLPKFYFHRNIQKRDHLRFTSRTLITFGISLILTIATPAVLLILNQQHFFVISLVISVLLIPVWIGLTNLITTPVYNISKILVQNKAAKIIAANPDLIIIGIVGSFGKTSTKNYLHELLKYNYQVQIVPGNISFPIGIAKWIINKFNTKTQVLIFEADGYKKGEVASICKMLPANFGIITAIGDQHLERLGSRKKIAETFMELITDSKPDSRIIMNKKSYEDFEKLGVYLKVRTKKEIITPTFSNFAAQLGTEQRENLNLAVEVAKQLGAGKDIIQDSIEKITPPDRRGNLIEYFGIETIDSSYNISPTTSAAALKLAKSLSNDRKLIVLTAGIPELGKENKNANFELGQGVAKIADISIILKSDFYEEIIKGMKSEGYDEKKIVTAKDMKEFQEYFSAIEDKESYLLLMLPELTDLYY